MRNTPPQTLLCSSGMRALHCGVFRFFRMPENSSSFRHNSPLTDTCRRLPGSLHAKPYSAGNFSVLPFPGNLPILYSRLCTLATVFSGHKSTFPDALFVLQ